MAVRRRWYVLAGALGLPAIVALVWLIDRAKDDQMRTQRGSATAAFVTGKVLVLVDGVSGTYTRVTSVDLATGEPTVRWWHTAAESCEPRDRGLIFCSVGGGVLLDAATLDVRGSTGERGRPMPSDDCPTHRTIGNAHTERAGVVTFGQAVAESAAPPVSAPVPGVQDLVGSTPRGVFAYAKINGKYALSYVLATGKLAWTVPVSGRCDAFAVVGDVAVLATSEWPDRALAIEIATGTVRWRVP